ncbi:MAG: hypothetical protein QW782_06935 [Candidatus Bathyarchaeia archaeon]
MTEKTRLIFMLTHHDRTVPNAFEVFEEIKDTGIQNVGFKDVGLPPKDLKRLAEKINREGFASFIEVVSESENSCLTAVKQAMKMGVKNIIGVKSEYAEKAFNIIGGSAKFYPYVGRVIGIPEILEGEVEEMIEEAERFEKMGVDGINLLAYRYKGDPEKLMERIIKSVNIDVIIAGSIDGFERIRKVIEAGASLYTIGGAIFERKFVQGGSIADQIKAILEFEKKIIK